ncbi:MAG: Iron-sulfur cluster-binding protein [Nitrospira sp.]|nr:MAG: Iron-sulfur cluster-binding protein [Nitrospira sp.]
MSIQGDHQNVRGITRRHLLMAGAAGILLGSGVLLPERFFRQRQQAQTFVAKVAHYQLEIGDTIARGIRELRVSIDELRGKRILLKPNLVETSSGAPHINTHPLVLRGTVEAFLRLGAATVMVAEGPGHRRDTLAVYEESGLADVLTEDRIPFQDLNYITGYDAPNLGRQSSLRTLTFPALFKEVDWIVSVAKMKTHHWAGATLSMKNLFGVMPGIYYGWPKNVLHHAGIENSILDINATLKPHFAIVDGIVGMQGDGPIMGDPKQAGVLVMGRNLAAVDATCCRIMGIDPYKVSYLERADNWLGPISDGSIEQRGESITSVRTNFHLIDTIPAQQGIRLA